MHDLLGFADGTVQEQLRMMNILLFVIWLSVMLK